VAVLPPVLPDWVTQGGAVGLLAVTVVMVLLGWLIPIRTHRETVRERDLWRTIALKAMGQAEALLPAARITAQVAQGLYDASTDPVQVDAPPGEPT